LIVILLKYIQIMATSKLNIFNALPQQASDDEDEGYKGQGKGAQGKKGNAPNDKNKGSKQVGTTGQAEGKGKDDHKKGKGVPAPGSHPLERHSGTGHSAYEKKDGRKQGAGKGNWGNYKDDNKKREEGGEEEATEETAPEPTGITLEEYYSKNKLAKNEAQVNEAKAKVTSEQLMKELTQGKATQIAPKNKNDSNEKAVPKKKVNPDEDQHLVIGQQQHADLLNFRTGFVERDFGKKRFEGDAPRKREERTERTERLEKDEKPQEKTENAGEGEVKVEKQEEGKPAEQRRGGYFPKGKFDKGHNGHPYGNSANRGNRPQGNNGGFKKNYQPQPKVNIGDDSAFPKLG
jgi:hypothetical protein